MRYWVAGKNNRTGEDVDLVIEAVDEQDARQQVSKRGVVISECTAAEPPATDDADASSTDSLLCPICGQTTPIATMDLSGVCKQCVKTTKVEAGSARMAKASESLASRGRSWQLIACLVLVAITATVALGWWVHRSNVTAAKRQQIDALVKEADGDLAVGRHVDAIAKYSSALAIAADNQFLEADLASVAMAKANKQTAEKKVAAAEAQARQREQQRRSAQAEAQRLLFEAQQGQWMAAQQAAEQQRQRQVRTQIDRRDAEQYSVPRAQAPAMTVCRICSGTGEKSPKELEYEMSAFNAQAMAMGGTHVYRPDKRCARCKGQGFVPAGSDFP